MKLHDLLKELREPTNNGTKIVLLVADGLGGLPLQPGGLTEMETARRPNLDALARDGVLGLSTPVLPGITPGSGPGHLGLFGYDPLEFRIGRGVLEALGINFHLERRDVAARGNFCTLDAAGNIADRRAGRPSDEENRAICQKLKPLRVPGAEVLVEPVSEHRFVVVFRADGLGEAVNDTDPQAIGVKPLEAKGADSASQKTAELANRFVTEAVKLLKGEKKANGVTLRGFARYPHIPTLEETTGLRCAALAVYPMYKGLARLVGMDLLDAGHNLTEQMRKLKEVWGKYDFFFIHFKYTDKTGEDGNFAEKVRRIEELDAIMPEVVALKPDVLIVTGDHSTPSKMKSHSWHPVPVLLWGQNVRTDSAKEFNEGSCLHGGLGQFEAKHLLTLALAHAGRLAKYGA
jgi:2,3-bisphosphoglycerate-independent phosphoglycerate mutase